MLKEEWPTERKLENLRERGITPYSHFATTCLIFMALCGYFFWIRGDLMQIFSPPNTLTAAREKVWTFLELLLFPALVVFFSVILSILFQVKFLFRLNFIVPTMQRVNPFEKTFSLTKILQLFIRDCLEIVCLCGVTYGVFLVGVGIIKKMLTTRAETGIFIPSHLMQSALPILATLALCLVCASLLGAKYLFLFKNRMSREELEREME